MTGRSTIVEGLAARGLDPTNATATVLFGPSSPPGREETFRADRAAVVVVGAPDGAPVVEGGVPASDLELEIRRARGADELEPSLPEPLAEPRLDFQVDRASALAYEVKEGEYIQIIDVRGRQCSDFLAFHGGKLQAGVERGLDSTATRSLVGSMYPQPGLYSKFFTVDLEPLVEVVRDTVGRHDTFGLACTRKYYEDKGYFGHVNCSENFNAQLEPYTVAARAGWPAINFFYNTGFDAHNLYILDEPWSRPGDYVLLRATTDLVCLSSACPDDIDAANAWNPTEVHVRVYPAKERFSAAIAHRVTPDAEPKLTKETAFGERTRALTGRFTEYNGYWLPTSYDNLGAVAEYWACREHAAIMDLSPLTEVRGARAGRRSAAAGDPDPRHPPSLGRAGRLHRHVQRHRRHDRRRHGVPHRADQLPLGRRLGVRRRVASRAGRAARAARLGEGVDGRAAQRRGAGALEP